MYAIRSYYDVGNKWIFIEDADASPEFSIKAEGLSSVTASTGKMKEKDGNYIISDLKPGVDCEISLNAADGNVQKIIVLSKIEALNSWLLDTEDGGKAFFISDAGLYANQGKVYAFDTNPNISVLKLNEEDDQNFESYNFV